MKKIWCLLLALCLCLCLSASAEETPVPAPFDNPQEIHLAAAGLLLYVPGDLETMEGDDVITTPVSVTTATAIPLISPCM